MFSLYHPLQGFVQLMVRMTFLSQLDSIFVSNTYSTDWSMILLRDERMVILLILLLFLVIQIFQIIKGNKVFQLINLLGIMGLFNWREWSHVWLERWELEVSVPRLSQRVLAFGHTRKMCLRDSGSLRQIVHVSSMFMPIWERYFLHGYLLRLHIHIKCLILLGQCNS